MNRKIVKPPKEKKQVSKAPAPFKGVSTSRRSVTVIKWRTTAEKPNWKEWKYTPQVRVWEACSLSLDIEPNSIKKHQLSWMTGPGIDQLFEDESFQSEDEKKEFKSRQRILLNNLNSKENPLWFSPNHNRPNLGEVSLPEFASWCPSVEWPIPKELAALAKKPDAAPATKEENKLTPSTPIKSEERQEIKGVEKKEIINAFRGIHYLTDEKWSNMLASPPDWLKRCIVKKGNKGKETKSALWNPVSIAIALYEKEVLIYKNEYKRAIRINDLNEIFNDWEEWVDEWHEKSERLRILYT